MDAARALLPDRRVDRGTYCETRPSIPTGRCIYAAPMCKEASFPANGSRASATYRLADRNESCVPTKSPTAVRAGTLIRATSMVSLKPGTSFRATIARTPRLICQRNRSHCRHRICHQRLLRHDSHQAVATQLHPAAVSAGPPTGRIPGRPADSSRIQRHRLASLWNQQRRQRYAGLRLGKSVLRSFLRKKHRATNDTGGNTMPLPSDERIVALADEVLKQFDLMFGLHPGFRPAHAKGVLLTGTFTATPQGKALTKAPHVQRDSTPVTVRFSDGSAMPQIPDTSPTPAHVAWPFDSISPSTYTPTLSAIRWTPSLQRTEMNSWSFCAPRLQADPMCHRPSQSRSSSARIPRPWPSFRHPNPSPRASPAKATLQSAPTSSPTPPVRRSSAGIASCPSQATTSSATSRQPGSHRTSSSTSSPTA